MIEAVSFPPFPSRPLAQFGPLKAGRTPEGEAFRLLGPARDRVGAVDPDDDDRFRQHAATTTSPSRCAATSTISTMLGTIPTSLAPFVKCQAMERLIVMTRNGWREGGTVAPGRCPAPAAHTRREDTSGPPAWPTRTRTPDWLRRPDASALINGACTLIVSYISTNGRFDALRLVSEQSWTFLRQPGTSGLR